MPSLIASAWVRNPSSQLATGLNGWPCSAALIGALISGDGHPDWFKGVRLILVYLMSALLFYFMPDALAG
jgi:Ca2+/H+ antiporter